MLVKMADDEIVEIDAAALMAADRAVLNHRLRSRATSFSSKA
jgi:hypothetical protein